MKKWIISAFALLILSSPLFAQNQEENYSFIRSLELSYLTTTDNVTAASQNLIGLSFNMIETTTNNYFKPTFDAGLAFNLDSEKDPMLFMTIIPGFTNCFLREDKTPYIDVFMGAGFVVPIKQGGNSDGAGMAANLKFKVYILGNLSVSTGLLVLTNTTFTSLSSISIGYRF